VRNASVVLRVPGCRLRVTVKEITVVFLTWGVPVTGDRHITTALSTI